MLKSLIFDLGRVIIPFDFARGYRALGERTGLDPDMIRDRIRALHIVIPFETGLIEPHAFVEQVTRALGVRMSYAEFCAVWSSIFFPETLIPEDFVAGLHGRYRLVVLSNTNAIHFEMVRRDYPILGHFDEYVLSHEVKAMKPDPKIFAAAVDAARCEPEECFFTDDIADYVEAARRHGIDAVQFHSFDQLRGALEQRGVKA